MCSNSIFGLNINRKPSNASLKHAWASNPSTLGGGGRGISEFEASLVYRVSSRTARATQRNPGSKKTNPTPQKKTTEKKTQKTKTNTKTKTMHGYTISKPNHIQLIHRNIGFI